MGPILGQVVVSAISMNSSTDGGFSWENPVQAAGSRIITTQLPPDADLRRQIEAARRAMTRHVKRGGKIWIRIFPDVPVTKKPLEVRQGKGKGNVEYWMCRIQPGKMLYEMEGVDEKIAREAFRLAAAKLPVKTAFVSRTIM